MSSAAGTAGDRQLRGPILIYSDSAALIFLKLIVFTVCEPEYMNMGPLNYRSSAVPVLLS